MFTSPSLLQSRAIGHNDGGPPRKSSFSSQTGSEILTSPSPLASHRMNGASGTAFIRRSQTSVERGGSPRVVVIGFINSLYTVGAMGSPVDPVRVVNIRVPPAVLPTASGSTPEILSLHMTKSPS